ncbi:(E2-independent) E3 ubiquitin-conjugating enzyme FATS isoform X2 [Heteronotia binoei]|uniref:(E2-independent) E3 ubiquitin-conjugating enzyme FATS isoform X2 n=1 Tax=Heteronotia binoei TaxID=13085 RepID=UPI00292CE090|nr:(E2-independent) E3 ubiquitin-conjugating enzyme FATS isoform X2 [Heteronotia binoei]
MIHEICKGRRENLYKINAWKPCRNIQYNNAAEKESSFSKDVLLAQNMKMSSSIVISQMIDENKSKENKAAFTMQSVITQSDAYHMNQSLVNHSSVNINRAFIMLPRRLVQISSDDSVFRTDSETKEKKQCPNQKKGFTSITITARRVVPPSYQTTQADASDSSCLQCQGGKLLMSTATALAVSGLDQVSRSLCNQASQNQTATKMKPSELCTQLRKESSDWLSSTENKENRMVSPESNHNEKAQSSFISSVHLHIPQQNPNTIYYIDKSLTMPINQTQSNNQKMHRSVMSFNINCSSTSLTPDGVDGLANGKLITEVLKTKLPEDSKTPLRAIWNTDPKEIYLDRKQTLETESLGTEYLWKHTSPSEALSVVDSPQGLSNLKLTKSNDKNPSDNHITLSPLIPHWTYDEDSQAFLRSSRKQCKRDKYHEAPSSFLDQSSKHELTAEGGSSLKDKYPSKGTLKSKEIQAQSFLKPKISVSDYGCHGKALLKTALDENDIHRNYHFPKGDYKFCDAADKLKGYNTSEKKEMVREVTTTSTVHVPNVSHEKHEAFQQPEVCSEPENIPSNPLSLREALEIHKPHFISRSQERLKKLEHMVQLRKAQQGDASGKKQGAALSRKLSSSSITSKKRQYTVPHPLSDNLFKPKERFISEKEMHMRSKRIYNNLPEVKKKQEEKQKQIILQSNRLRVEVFKKQLLDQLLQRNTI